MHTASWCGHNLEHTNITENCMTHVQDMLMTYKAAIFQITDMQPHVFFSNVMNVVANQEGN